MQITRKTSHKSAFSLLELLIVTGIIIILLGFIIIAVGGGVQFADSMKCAKKISSLTAGLTLFAEDHNGELPWAGGVDRNRHKDWVWGGQGKGQTRNTREWINPSPTFGHHAEAGGAFPYITNLKLHRLRGVKYDGDANDGGFDPIDFDYNDDGKRSYGLIDEGFKTVFQEYRCPNSGEYEQLAKALRVNYSMNAWIDTHPKNPYLSNDIKSKNEGLGTFFSHIRKPALKIMMVDEDSRTQHNASIWPGGSADGDGHTGTDFDQGQVMVMHNKKTNASFVDGHVERLESTRAWMIQQTLNDISSNGSKMGMTPEEVSKAVTDKNRVLPDGRVVRDNEYYRRLYWNPQE